MQRGLSRLRWMQVRLQSKLWSHTGGWAIGRGAAAGIVTSRRGGVYGQLIGSVAALHELVLWAAASVCALVLSVACTLSESPWTLM